jgi:hypothetical protein
MDLNLTNHRNMGFLFNRCHHADCTGQATLLQLRELDVLMQEGGNEAFVACKSRTPMLVHLKINETYI